MNTKEKTYTSAEVESIVKKHINWQMKRYLDRCFDGDKIAKVYTPMLQWSPHILKQYGLEAYRCAGHKGKRPSPAVLKRLTQYAFDEDVRNFEQVNVLWRLRLEEERSLL